jgi:hypothetical protein
LFGIASIARSGRHGLIIFFIAGTAAGKEKKYCD